ncbi:MAG: hypothetical protein A2Z29_08355 [Chloroflexi bacterium RBG_16_56_11]|nr:MAG: hypothetical protein A2Z29_08355 [Chloroflexi bacterium RBG_16_56_11]HJX13991.1 acylphosphatase [Dehalococcoidales bacterium]
MADLAALQAKVRGRVQGVFFRDFVRRQAESLKLSGYVSNAPDGSVEVRAEGGREQLEKLVGYLRAGPPAARVEEVTVDWPPPAGNFPGFTVMY